MKRLMTIAAVLVASLTMSACSFMSQAYYDFNDYMALRSGEHHGGEQGGAIGSTLLTVYFAFDRAELTPEAKADLSVLAENLAGRTQRQVQIVGHTDSSGSDEYNQALSMRRANAVRDELVGLGVDESNAMVSVTGRGEDQLAVATGDGVREAANRRVTIHAGSKGGGGMMMHRGQCPTIIGADAFCAWPHNHS